MAGSAAPADRLIRPWLNSSGDHALMGELWRKDYLGDLFFNRSAIRWLCLSVLTLRLWTRAKLRVCSDNHRGASLWFLNPAVQLTITLTGVVLTSSAVVTIRNLCPSAVMSYTGLC